MLELIRISTHQWLSPWAIGEPSVIAIILFKGFLYLVVYEPNWHRTFIGPNYHLFLNLRSWIRARLFAPVRIRIQWVWVHDIWTILWIFTELTILQQSLQTCSPIILPFEMIKRILSSSLLSGVKLSLNFRCLCHFLKKEKKTEAVC